VRVQKQLGIDALLQKLYLDEIRRQVVAAIFLSMPFHRLLVRKIQQLEPLRDHCTFFLGFCGIFAV